MPVSTDLLTSLRVQWRSRRHCGCAVLAVDVVLGLGRMLMPGGQANSLTTYQVLEAAIAPSDSMGMLESKYNMNLDQCTLAPWLDCTAGDSSCGVIVSFLCPKMPLIFCRMLFRSSWP